MSGRAQGHEPGQAAGDEDAKTIWTIGHWTCPVPDVLATLASARISLIVDVRKLPGSRRSPQFNADEMTDWLGEAGIGYVHLENLAGRRPKQPDVDESLTAGWQNASFRNYADYTRSADFARGLRELERLAETERVALLCGEPMPWRCHRLLIANSLAARGWRVVHLTVNAAPREHELGQWGAQPVEDVDGQLIYPVL